MLNELEKRAAEPPAGTGAKPVIVLRHFRMMNARRLPIGVAGPMASKSTRSSCTTCAARRPRSRQSSPGKDEVKAEAAREC
jgi:hypothetical protein